MSQTLFSNPIQEFFELVGFRDRGIIATERVLLKARRSVNLSNFILTSGHALPDERISIMNDLVMFFRISEPEIAAGEYLRIYTKAGEYRRSSNTMGDRPATFHNYYLQRTSPVWIGDRDAVMLVRPYDWTTLRMNP